VKKAEAIYAQFRAGGVALGKRITEHSRITFFRVLIDQAGKLHLPVHFHSAGRPLVITSGLRKRQPAESGKNVLREPALQQPEFRAGFTAATPTLWT